MYVSTAGGQMAVRVPFFWNGSAWVAAAAGGGASLPAPSTYVDTPGGKMSAVVPLYWNGTAWVMR
jgi:hypothetical protein